MYFDVEVVCELKSLGIFCDDARLGKKVGILSLDLKFVLYSYKIWFFFISESVRFLPYFSHGELVRRFAANEKLNFSYYLKRGRPTYAFLAFLADEIDQGTTTLSQKR